MSVLLLHPAADHFVSVNVKFVRRTHSLKKGKGKYGSSVITVSGGGRD